MTLEKELWLLIIKTLHWSFFVWMTVTPFTNNRENLVLHAILCPFLLFHWILNNDTCAVTELEKKISGKTENTQTFVGSIISPIYKFVDKVDVPDDKKITKLTLLLLWVLTIKKLYF